LRDRRKADAARFGRTAGTPGAMVAWSQSWGDIEPRRPSSRRCMDERRAVSSAERVSARRRRASTQYGRWEASGPIPRRSGTNASVKTAPFECIWRSAHDPTPPPRAMISTWELYGHQNLDRPGACAGSATAGASRPAIRPGGARSASVKRTHVAGCLTVRPAA
jgi:hypothetical protein